MAERTLLLRGGVEYQIDYRFYTAIRDLYPELDIDSQIRSMQAWCLAAPEAKRKTPRGVQRFVVNWLNGSKNKLMAESAKAVAGIKLAASHKPFKTEKIKKRVRSEVVEKGIEALRGAMRK